MAEFAVLMTASKMSAANGAIELPQMDECSGLGRDNRNKPSDSEKTKDKFFT